MKQLMLKVVGLGLLLGGSAGIAQSAAAPKAVQNVKLTLTQDLIRSVVQGSKTQEERVPAPSTVLPGAVLLEEVTAVNVGAKSYSGLTVRVPVPKGTQFFGGATPSSTRWKTEYSVDNGKTYGEAPLKRNATDASGKTVQVEVKPSEYTNVRWVIGSLKADETVKLSFRVKVN